MNIVFTTAVVVHITKYIYGRHMYDELMHAQQSGSCGVQDFKIKYCIYSCYGCLHYQMHL